MSFLCFLAFRYHYYIQYPHLNKEIDRRIGRASGTFAKLRKRVWENQKLTITTKISVYRACVLSTLLYGSETWASYATQEKRLNSFHLRHLRLILGKKWQDKLTNNEVLERAGIVSPDSFCNWLDTSEGWKMAGCLRICCTANLLRERMFFAMLQECL